MTTEAEYGSWKSPLTSKLACDSSVSIKGIFVDPETPGYAMFFFPSRKPGQDIINLVTVLFNFFLFGFV